MANAPLRTRTRAGVSLLTGILMLVAGDGAAVGHEVRRFEACASRNSHGMCIRSMTFTEGDVGFLRGEVDPPHGRLEARTTYLRPGAKRWRRGVDVSISPAGRMSEAFRAVTEMVDEDPWLFRFRISGHGKSDRVKVWVEPAS
jgi:hypothetical protein